GTLLWGEQDPPNRYTPMIPTFPVSGDSGTLEDRFDDPTEAAGRGVVRAKTGTLNTVTALSGRVTRDDGERMIAVVLFDGVQDTGVARNRADEFFATLAQS
ncbi:D-alanyl-D-alanine carboxypeptidase, partial [Kocuria subflava]